MRGKRDPTFLSIKRRNLKTFFFHPNQPASDPWLKPSIRRTSRKRKSIGSKEDNLTVTFPHSIVLQKIAAPVECLFQTVSLPINMAVSKVLLECQKLTLYFNSSAFLLRSTHTDPIHEFESAAHSEVTSLLFAASSNLLDVHFRVEPCFIYLDICIKSRSITVDNDLVDRPITRNQYEKIHDFMTFQLLDQSVTLRHPEMFIYARHSETQAEFVTLIKFLYDSIQEGNIEARHLWDNPSLSVQSVGLIARLRPYQIDAVKWMVYKESYFLEAHLSRLHEELCYPVALPAVQRTLYFSVLTGMFTDRLPAFKTPCLGGILADEMGLGKTLEVTALVLLRPWSEWSSLGGSLRSLDGELYSRVQDMETNPDTSLTRLNPDDVLSVLCSCGNSEETQSLELVQCTRCLGPRQHAACVQYEGPYTQLPVKHDYICPKCWTELRIDSKATLIVAPDHIWQQWKEELQTHVAEKAIDVLLYAGMEAPVTEVELGGRNGPTASSSVTNPYAPRSRVQTCGPSGEEEELLPGFVQPGRLAAADIVLTSYSVVQRELDWAEVVAERQAGLSDRPRLRLAQRYLCRPSPLTCVHWWRVCLDEAQMVERVTSKTARMMFQIQAKHRWCITGTPAEKSIDDLFGLFAFLRFEPFSIPHYWHSLLYQPFLAATAPSWVIHAEGTNSMSHQSPECSLKTVQSTRLASVLGQILWRNTKVLVADQLVLPPISETIHWINFTPVERYIHDRVLAESAGALQGLQKSLAVTACNLPLASLPGTAHGRLILLITRLRQACTHASLVVASGGGSGTAIERRPKRRNDRSTAAQSDESGLVDGPRSGYRRDNLGIGNRNAGASGCFTMREVIRRVVDDTRRECEGLLRTWVFNKIGAAGCFILKQQFEEAAQCYREVLLTGNNLEQRDGVLADWSQRLHAITNLHWLIQSRGVALLDTATANAVHDHQILSEPQSDGQCTTTPSIGTSCPPMSGEGGGGGGGGEGEGTEDSLDPRVDRDLCAKAERLRKSYIQSHSRLLARVHDSLEPVASELDGDLIPPVSDDADESTEAMPSNAYGLEWVSWLSDAIDFLISNGMGTNLVVMLMASFQGKPGGYRGSFRTTLLHATTVETFKAVLLTEVVGLFEARRRLRDSMEPVMVTWNSFLDGKEADPNILRPFYACCARSADPDDPNSDADGLGKSPVKKKADRELKGLKIGAGKTRKPVKRTQCAYCLVLRALSNYQCALNHERLRAGHQTMMDQLDKLCDPNDDSTLLDEVGTGLTLSNPLLIALSIVCNQAGKLAKDSTAVWNGQSIADWPRRARHFEQIFRRMGQEIMLTSRTLSLTREWWNIHDDTEQFVLRLQMSSPTDMAFIHAHEVDLQLHTHCVESLMVWPRIHTRLGHFRFLRTAHLSSVTGGASGSDASTTTHRLECPTCLQAHSDTNPTFALLPGCWHTLCVPCHDRIAAQGQSAQRRCPVCRTPFEAGGMNARRRRPLTLIHYAGEADTESQQQDQQQQHRVVCTKAPGDLDAFDCNVVGDHSSKVQAVIRCLKQIKNEDPDAKAIVFSSWLSVLITIAGALEHNGLAYTTLFQPRDACCPGRLAGFQCLGSATWILLMPIQLGANGLNLTSANHLLLIDPVLSHGREAQAIARMHRAGQTRLSTVHRFLVRDSIEAALHATLARDTNTKDAAATTTGCVDARDCMIGAGPFRTSATSSGMAGPGEDRAQLMSMTLDQLTALLTQSQSFSMPGMVRDELEWAQSTAFSNPMDD